MPELKNKRVFFLSAMIFLAALSRLLPHPWNFTPIGAMALFGAAHFSKKYLAFLIPFTALWISNLLISNLLMASYYDGFVWFSHGSVFLAFGAIVLLGMVLLRKITVGRLIAGSLSASIIFFLITNFAVWMGSVVYPQNISGLIACYTVGIPFFWNTLAGDLFYVSVLFGVFEWVKYKYPSFVIT